MRFLSLFLLGLIATAVVVPHTLALDMGVPKIIDGPAGFLPFRLIMTFPYTNLPITIKTSAATGMSNPQTTFTFTSIVFSATEPDRYELDVQVNYIDYTNGTITWIVYSGDEVADTDGYAGVFNSFHKHFTITTSIKPHYPTAEERQADVQAAMGGFWDEVRGFRTDVGDNFVAMYIIIGLLIVLTIVALAKRRG